MDVSVVNPVMTGLSLVNVWPTLLESNTIYYLKLEI